MNPALIGTLIGASHAILAVVVWVFAHRAGVASAAQKGATLATDIRAFHGPGDLAKIAVDAQALVDAMAALGVAVAPSPAALKITAAAPIARPVTADELHRKLSDLIDVLKLQAHPEPPK